VGKAPLFPADIPKVIFPVSSTVYDTFYQDSGFNPCPRFCENAFRKAWDLGVQHGTMAYSEGSQDFLNHILLMQMAWEPERPVDEILGEVCIYYFGEKAASHVKDLAYLFEREGIDLISSHWKKPRTNRENIQTAAQLVRQAERVMPAWARNSRQWEMVVGRAGITRTRYRQAELMEEFEDKWIQYQAVRSAPAIGTTHIELMGYFRSILDNALDMQRILDRVSRKGFYPLGGMNFMVGPMRQTGDAVEALAVLENIGSRRGKPGATGRWCVAVLDENGNVGLNDGYHNRLRSSRASLDTHLVISDIRGEGTNRVLYVSSEDRNLYAWKSPDEGPILVAEGNFWSGPLAAGDLTGDGIDEVVLMSGETAIEGELSVVARDGNIRPLGIVPRGPAPIDAPKNLVRVDVQPSRSSVLPMDPRVVICDLRDNGKNRIICSDAKDYFKLVVVDGDGKKKPLGFRAPGGVLAVGNLDDPRMGVDRHGDAARFPEIVYADTDGCLTVCTATGKRAPFVENPCPRWNFPVAIMQPVHHSLPSVVFIDKEGFPSSIGMHGKSRRLSELHTSVAVGPGLASGYFDGDGGMSDVMYLRSRLDAYFPLCKLSYVDRTGALRDQPNYMQGGFFATPWGPLAAGRIQFK
jgi:hypothetical protein